MDGYEAWLVREGCIEILDDSPLETASLEHDDDLHMLIGLAKPRSPPPIFSTPVKTKVPQHPSIPTQWISMDAKKRRVSRVRSVGSQSTVASTGSPSTGSTVRSSAPTVASRQPAVFFDPTFEELIDMQRFDCDTLNSKWPWSAR